MARYLKVLRADPRHPLACAAPGAARRRAALPRRPGRRAPPRRLGPRDNVYCGWLLLAGDPGARPAAQRRLEPMLLADRRTPLAYLRLAEVPVRAGRSGTDPHPAGGDAARPGRLARGGAGACTPTSPSPIRRSPSPAACCSPGEASSRVDRDGRGAASTAPRPGSRWRCCPQRSGGSLCPVPTSTAILAQGRIRKVDPDLLAALIREESQFDTALLSPASSRGLTHLSIATARRLAAQLKLGAPHARGPLPPEVSIALGAAYLGALLKDFGGGVVPALAAYEPGEPEAMVWRSLCFSQEPEEQFTKLGTADIRDYVRRVLGVQGAVRGAVLGLGRLLRRGSLLRRGLRVPGSSSPPAAAAGRPAGRSR